MAGDLSELPEEYQNIPRDFFRYGSGKYSNIILIPQPSDSPNDPLNVSLHYIKSDIQCSLLT